MRKRRKHSGGVGDLTYVRAKMNCPHLREELDISNCVCEINYRMGHSTPCA